MEILEMLSPALKPYISEYMVLKNMDFDDGRKHIGKFHLKPFITL